MQKILVTGSSGTIGTELVERLLDAGHDVVGVDAVPNRWSERVDDRTRIVDLSDREAASALDPDVDMIVHLAANARVHQLVEEPERAMDNMEMTFNVLEHARRNDISKVVFSSSREVYGNKNKLVYSEEDTYTDECESPYTASKIGGEALVNSYGKCYGIDSCLLRFSNVYGRYDASNRVVPLFIAQASRGRNLTVYGDDKVLDFTHLDDCVDGILRVILNFEKAKDTTLNIASGDGTSLLELAETVIDALETDVDVTVEPNRTGEVSKYIADISKARKLLDYEPRYTFSEGVDSTIDWYQRRPHLFDTILSA